MQNASETASSCIAGGQEIASDDEYWRSFARVTSSSTAMLLEQHAYGLYIYTLVALVGDAAAAAQVGSSSFGAVASSSHRTTQDANETYNSPRSVASELLLPQHVVGGQCGIIVPEELCSDSLRSPVSPFKRLASLASELPTLAEDSTSLSGPRESPIATQRSAGSTTAPAALEATAGRQDQRHQLDKISPHHLAHSAPKSLPSMQSLQSFELGLPAPTPDGSGCEIEYSIQMRLRRAVPTGWCSAAAPTEGLDALRAQLAATQQALRRAEARLGEHEKHEKHEEHEEQGEESSRRVPAAKDSEVEPASGSGGTSLSESDLRGSRLGGVGFGGRAALLLRAVARAGAGAGGVHPGNGDGNDDEATRTGSGDLSGLAARRGTLYGTRRAMYHGSSPSAPSGPPSSCWFYYPTGCANDNINAGQWVRGHRPFHSRHHHLHPHLRPLHRLRECRQGHHPHHRHRPHHHIASTIAACSLHHLLSPPHLFSPPPLTSSSHLLTASSPLRAHAQASSSTSSHS